MNRRNFLAGTSLVLASGPSGREGADPPSPRSSRSSAPSGLSLPLEFASALKAAEAIRQRKISSVELTHLIFDRIDRYNPALNAFVYQLREQALERAAHVDNEPSKPAAGFFRGVPIHVKESFAVAGQPCTWGMVPVQVSKAPRNSAVVDRLLDTGAILIGATNVPVNLADWQTYNPIYGTTNNPWDLKRTPSGSSGGSAAALAAGLGYLSVGSDIGGSIRVPAHFCGIFGHKPTLDLVDFRGHAPGGNSAPPGFSTLLAAAGPLARSAEDLLAALKILGGPSGWDAKAWKWSLPEPRASKLSDFRIGYVLDDPFSRPTSDVSRLLESTLQTLSRAGARLKPGWPASFKPAELLSAYHFLLNAFIISVSPPEERERQRKELEKLPVNSEASLGAFASFADWQQQNFRRLAFRAQWQAYFNEIDVFLSPVAFCAAFPHDHSEPIEARRISTSDGSRPYMEMFNWICIPSLTGCPATVAPVGLTEAGLPVGIQIMGPYWEDATPLTFATLLERETGGFTPPPGYSKTE